MKLQFLLAMAMVSSSAAATSFDCAKASTSVEKSICADKQLGDLDDSLAGAYKAALSDSNNAESIRVRQREWLTGTRNKCPDSACIRNEYIKRLAELSYGSRSAVGELLAKAAQGAASRTPIPVYVPVSLQSLDADVEDGCAFAVSAASSFSITVYGRLTGYDQTKPLPCEENGAALIAEIHGDIKPMPDLSGRRSAQKVALQSGAPGWFLPVACGVSCTPATLYWQTHAASYSIQMKFGSAVAEARQRKELLDTANSLVLAGAPAAGAGIARPALITQVAQEPEDMPVGVMFLDTAATPGALAEKFRANLTWEDADGARLFLRVENSSDAAPTFRINRAYYVRQQGRQFWAFLDVSVTQGQDYQSAPVQATRIHHVAEILPLDQGLRDGNRSSATTLARREGAAVYRLIYASLGGDRAHQEEVRTYLVFRSARGEWQLAAREAGVGDSAAKSGWMAMSWSTASAITWTPGGDAPFRVDLKTTTNYSQGSEGVIPSYHTVRDGALTGRFPLTMRMDERTRYEAASNSANTLRQLADILATYHSDWTGSPWVDSPADARRQAVQLWMQSLQRLNPGTGPDETLQRDRSIDMPDVDATGRSILEQLRERVKK